MAQDDVVIQIVERQQPLAVDSLDYQPFGVKVIKLRVQRNQATKPALGKIWVRPKGYVRTQAKSKDPARWRAFGAVEGDPDLWVAWGAGDEDGFGVKLAERFIAKKETAPLDDDRAYYIYLHLIDRPPDPFSRVLAAKTLTVQAVDEHGGVHGEKKIQLTVPAQASNPARAHWDWNLDNGVSTITFRGADGGTVQVPRYVSRWWPTRQVQYGPADLSSFLQNLKITYERQGQNENLSQLRVWLGDTLLARIGGYLGLPLHDCRLVSLEVFRFLDDYHWVVRLWFFWLHLNFTPDQLMAFVPPSRRDGWQAEAKRVCASLGNPLIPYYRREEVPDIERFDLIVNPQNLDHKYVGTDTHWQEFWATVKEGEPLKAKIAEAKDIRKIVEQSGVIPKKEPPVFEPLENGLCSLVNEYSGHECPHGLNGRVVSAVTGALYSLPRCERCGTYFDAESVREPGLWDKHAPWLENAELGDATVSTSVLDG